MMVLANSCLKCTLLEKKFHTFHKNGFDFCLSMAGFKKGLGS